MDLASLVGFPVSRDLMSSLDKQPRSYFVFLLISDKSSQAGTPAAVIQQLTFHPQFSRFPLGCTWVSDDLGVMLDAGPVGPRTAPVCRRREIGGRRRLGDA